MTIFAFPPSAFIPVVVGLFGLGTGYFIWGGQALFGYPKPVPEVEKTMGMWGLWMPGFIAVHYRRLYLRRPHMVSSLLHTRGEEYLAFLHGGASLHGQRYSLVRPGAPPLHRLKRPADAWMSIAYFLLSVLGVVVFVVVPDIPIAIVFTGLALIYLTDSLTRFGVFPAGGRLVGLWQALTGIWLLYLTWAFNLNLSLGMHQWV